MQVRYASNSGAAYDLNRFGAHRQRGRKPNLTIAAPSAKARARAGMAAAFKTAAALALVAAVCGDTALQPSGADRAEPTECGTDKRAGGRTE